MKIGIMGAMPEEVAGIVEKIEARQIHTLGGREYVSGRWHGVDVVVVFSRWGKVAAAATAAVLLAQFGVEGIVFVGVAGGADPELELGDIVVATDLLQYDMDASAIPIFQRFEIPLLGRSRFEAHAPWVSKALNAATGFVEQALEAAIEPDVRALFGIGRPKVVSGLIASGDRFVSDPVLLRDLRDALPDLRCVEMEGGAVAQTCFEFDKPCAVIRVISDKADHAAPIDFQRFVASVTSIMTANIAARLIEALSAELSPAG